MSFGDHGKEGPLAETFDHGRGTGQEFTPEHRATTSSENKEE